MSSQSFLAPVLVAGLSRAVAITTDGEIVEMPPRELADFLHLRDPAAEPPVLCHAPACARRLGLAGFAARDVLELYAFVRPARFCLPTPRGVAEALGMTVPPGAAGEAEALQAAAQALLDELTNLAPDALRDLEPVAQVMARAGWSWGPDVLDALGAASTTAPTAPTSLGALRAWTRLSEWQEEAPPAPPASWPVFAAEARMRLDDLVNEPGAKGTAEVRPQQADYTAAAAQAFAPRDIVGEPRVVLAEAGTGVGKTLGYIAPASLWAEKNGGAVWLSTYTRNLQRQLDTELDRLHPDPADKANRVVIRKGRENYLCLLNLEEQVNRATKNPREAIAAGLMARWVRATRDGDMVGGDFPSWLAHLLGYAPTLGLADRRGECIYAACDQGRK
jgi:ATP-dependent DNA helicase DinG